MQPFNKEEMLIRCRESLNQLLNGFASISNAQNGKPANNSIAAVLNWPNPYHRHATTCNGFIALSTSVACDHVSAFNLVAVEPIPFFSLWTLVRGILEPCADAVWLADNSIDYQERSMRLLHSRHEGVKADMRLIQKTDADPAKMAKGKRALANIEALAIQSGIRVIQGNKFNFIGQHPEDVTDKIEKQLGFGIIYKSLSMVAHAHIQSLLAIGTAELGVKRDEGANEVIYFERSFGPDGLFFLTEIAFRAFAKAIWVQSQYYGWDPIECEEVIDTAADTLNLSKAVRFWRSPT